MKARLTFDLNDPEDAMAHKRCVKATDMAIALFDIQNNAWRHVEDFDTYRSNINAIIENNGILLDELID